MTPMPVRSSQWDQEPLQIGDAVSVTILLADWDKFGLSERVCYHFDLIETLTASPTAEGNVDTKEEYARRTNERNVSSSDDGVCGVASLLECVPKTVKYKRRDVRSHIIIFNMHAQRVRQEAKVACFEPSHLPLRLSTATRVSFAYEVTKLAFCLDASPTLLTTFGNGLGMQGGDCCPLDRLGEMTATFFKSLVRPITAPTNPKGWRPIIAVTVLAVYPNASGASDTNILVRDFRVFDTASAELLSKEIAHWALRDVEDEIATRMGHDNAGGIHSWNRPTPSSSLRDVFDASDVALSLLPSHARPCIVLATDCRAITCESIFDLFQDSERIDTPLVVLDLSSSSSHSPRPPLTQVSDDKTTFLTHDPGTSWSFPLHLSDDSESLFGICQATGGAFFDADLLRAASDTLAGRVQEQSPLASDPFFAFKRRALRPNAVQWYTLFSLSPLSPCLHPSWGKLAPPTYIQERQKLLAGDTEAKSRLALAPLRSGSMDSAVRNPSVDRERRGPLVERTVFSSYVVSPVRVKGLLLMRVKEGYRAKQYGQSTQDPDKVSIQFKLPLEFGATVLHYELSYRALDDRFPYVGVANIKIELSGERNFIQMVKNDFISNLVPVQKSRPSTIAMRASANLCKILRGMRREDCLQAYLCPLSLKDKLSTSDSPFARRLGTLSQLQRRRHFRLDEFDVLCVGRMPYEHGEYLILSEFIDFDSGEQELYDSLSDWSTQVIKEKKRYVKKTSSSRDDLVAYCVIEVARSGSTARIFTVAVETFGGSCAVDRLALLSSLKSTISKRKDVIVLPKPMNEYLVGLRDPDMPELKLLRKQRFLESHFHHKSWSGDPTPELLSLLTKRRNEIGGFWFLHSSDTYSLFAKLVTDDGGRLVDADFTKSSDSTSSELYQVQYQIAVISGSIVIDMHVEREQGVFFAQSRRQTTRFHELFERVRVHDQECGRALNSRTKLLSLLRSDGLVSDQSTHVERLLKYASRLSRKLRFFHSGAAVANKVLEEHTVQLLLSKSSGIQVIRLSLESVSNAVDIDHGIWLLIQFDGHTMGFAHLASSERQERASGNQPSFMFRELTFFSIGISDLYCKRDLIADDDSSDDHISEYMCVSEYADHIEERHGQNYARAAYLALRSGGKTEQISFDRHDFEYAVGHCRFSEFKTITLVQDNESQEGDSTVSRAITEALSIVPGDKYCLFYNGDEGAAPLEVHVDDTDIDAIDDEDESETPKDGEFSDDDVDSNHYAVEHHRDASSHQGFSLSSDGSQVPFGTHDVLPPIFVRLYLDEELIAPDDIRVSKSATLSAHISLFDLEGEETRNHFDDLDPSLVPEAHYAVALRIRSLLDSYVAEQQLERIRHHGKSITRGDLKLARLCLHKARHVLSHDVKIQFYNTRSDSMVNPASPMRGDTEVDQAIEILSAELQRDSSIQMESTSSIGLFVSNTVVDGPALSYWCFVTVKIHLGVVNVKLYHPEGERKAAKALSVVFDHIERTIHRVNQVLLLRSLHRSRAASDLLIPADDGIERKSIEGGGARFNPGSFGCPVKYMTSFPLYERCVSVASQVVLSLEASVLDSFAVSNRRGVFVYKDESEAVFYMKLRPVVSDGKGLIANVELLVFGLFDPGPSVTRQLTRLLQRKVHTLAVDALSAVLTKNTHLKWKASDVEFLRSFDESYRLTEDERELPTFPNVVEYAVPDYLYDPIMLLVYFRQNMCGSTYFHRLHQPRAEAGNHDDIRGALLLAGGEASAATVPFDPREFALFYNNAPSPLDPKFQAVCTLTSKGKEYYRQAGTGIAIIEVTLIGRDGRMVQTLDAGKIRNETEPLSVPDAALFRLQRVENNAKVDGLEDPEYRVRVSIVDTALDRETLHNWVELTLNQVLIAWVTERHIQESQFGLSNRKNILSPGEIERQNSSVSNDRLAVIDTLLPGSARLFDVLDSSHDLPHPAIAKLELGGVIKASSVATIAIEMLEICSNALVRKDSCQSESRPLQLSGTTIIRLSRTELPSTVNLVRDLRREKAYATKSAPVTSDEVIHDSPIDCPEYLCFYCSSHCGSDENDDGGTLSPSAMCFREVVVDGKSDGRKGIPFVDALQTLRKTSPSVFSRSLVFVLSVKRNRRMVMVYNWNPKLWESVSSRLRDVNTMQRNIATESVHSVQRRCLQILSPPVTKHDPPLSQKTGKGEALASKKETREKNVAAVGGTDVIATDVERARIEKPPSRRIRRPTSIRRPKLIGKSVEGGAMQAVAASRHRASTTIGASPQQKTAKTDVPVLGRSPKANAPSSVAPVESRDDGRQLDTKSNQDKRASPYVVLLVKAYAANLSLTSQSPFHNSRTIETLLDKYWVAKPENPIHSSLLDFFLARSLQLWSSACTPLGFPDRMMEHVSSYFVQWLKMSNPDFDILQLNAPSQCASIVSPSSTIMAELKRVNRRKLCAVIRTSLRYKHGHKDPTIHCEAWMLFLARGGEDIASAPVKQKNRKSAAMQERESTLLDKKIAGFAQSINLDIQFFNFSSFLIEHSIQPWKESLSAAEMLSLLKEMMKRYSFERQRITTGLKYAAFDASIILASYENPLINLYDSNRLFDYLSSNSSSHEMILCNADGLCFKTQVSVQETCSTCFLTRDVNDVGKMQLLILTRLEGRQLKEYVFRKGNPVGIQLVDMISIACAATAQAVLQAAAGNIRRDMLWASFSSQSAKRNEHSLEGLRDFTETVSSVPLGDIDPRLPSVLFDPGNEFRLDWRDCSKAMAADPLFFPHASFDDDRNNMLTHHLFYMEPFDEFLCATVSNKDGRLVEALLLSRDPKSESNDESTVLAGQAIANYIMHFLWHWPPHAKT